MYIISSPIWLVDRFLCCPTLHSDLKTTYHLAATMKLYTTCSRISKALWGQYLTKLLFWQTCTISFYQSFASIPSTFSEMTTRKWVIKKSTKNIGTDIQTTATYWSHEMGFTVNMSTADGMQSAYLIVDSPFLNFRIFTQWKHLIAHWLLRNFRCPVALRSTLVAKFAVYVICFWSWQFWRSLLHVFS